LGPRQVGAGTFSTWTIAAERIYFAEGTGMWYWEGFIAGPTSSNKQIITSCTAGIENLVGDHVCWPPGGNPILVCGDRPFWPVPVQPIGTTGLPGYGPNYASALREGSALDWASGDPSFIVGSCNISYSPSNGPWNGSNSNGGAVGSWTPFATSLPFSGGAFVAAASSTNFIIGDISAGVDYTTDGGNTWDPCTGIPSGVWQTSNSQYNRAVQGCADRVNIGTFYLHRFGTVYKSTNQGAAFSQVYSGLGTNSEGYYNSQIEAVPGNAGHLFFTQGLEGSTTTSIASVVSSHPTSARFFFSANGASAWSALPNVREVLFFGIGAAMPGGNGYPSIFICGWVNQGSSYQYGFWRGDNFNPSTLAITWNFLGAYPRGWIDNPTALAGDPNQWGRCIAMFQGSSAAIYQVGGQPNNWP
jgi:hypothetical protein